MSTHMLKNITEELFSRIELNDGTSLVLLKFDKNLQNRNDSFTKLTRDLLNIFANSTRTGSAHQQEGISLKNFFIPILVSLAYFFTQFLIFVILRNIFKHIYQAKALLHPQNFKKSWLLNFAKPNYESTYKAIGLDAFLFLRFIKLLGIFFGPIALTNLPILLPVHYSANPKFKSLDTFNMSNSQGHNMTIHLIICLFTVGWFHFVLINELKYVKPIINEEINRNIFQNILFVEAESYDKQKIREKFKITGSVDDICFIPKNYKILYKQWKEIYSLEKKLESISLQIFLEKFYDDKSSLSLKRTGKQKILNLELLKFNTNKCLFVVKTSLIRLKCHFKYRIGSSNSKSFIRERQLNMQSLIKSYQARTKIFTDLCKTINENQKANIVCSRFFYKKVFIQFDSSITANIFNQLYNNNKPGKISIVGPYTQDIVWYNVLHKSSIFLYLRVIITRVLSVLIIIGWIVPVALIGLISQIPYVTYLFITPSKLGIESEFLDGILLSIIPIVTLIFLIECVPYIFRLFSYLKGCKTGREIEIDVQKWFFAFLFVHLFLVVTISSGVSVIIGNLINNPITVPSLLAEELPKSSNFFCSFVIIRGIAYSGGNFLRIKELLFELFYFNFKIYTPHSYLRRLKKSLFFNWGSIYPIFTVLACIVLIYSVIAPLILVCAFLSFTFVYFSFKYLLEYQYNDINESETFGKLYLQALFQLYGGIYFLQFCLLGLFALSNKYCLSVTMLVLIVSTIFSHYKLSHLYNSPFHQIDYEKNSEKEAETPYPTRSRVSHSLLNDHQYINIDFRKNYHKIWIPFDEKNIAIYQQRDFEEKFQLICDIDKCFIDSCGNMHLQV